MPFPYFLSGGLLIIIRWASAWRRGERPIHRVPIGDLESPQWAQVGSDLIFVWQNYLLTPIKLIFWHRSKWCSDTNQGKTWGACDGAQCKGKILPLVENTIKLNLSSSSSSQLFVFKMCTYAQEWADQMLAENRFQHRSAPPFFWESYS